MSRSPEEPWTINDLRSAYERYAEIVNTSDLAPSTKTTYLVHADRFVRWMAGEISIRGEQ
ncbi:hypothetical protein A6A08_21390 [Nocardiopsis sp. TSRI0078]|uniref:hypothetical protein n=1 Tax=unclassified Nocardiopsis TaxID=2649073 RepID=UPI00093B158C|nr:hypothetical protein [Nocardiopsis sp. TSRI0078]OKI21340.1 hypothetical protein A6A08_21390 [Nocardiopsis sp. TSRI0078]